jgi:cell division cycle protein 20 (cofactor of APC complex)
MPPTTLKRYQSYQKLLESSPRAKALDNLQSWKRPIRQEAEEVLDAPGVLDDFYTSLLDWSSTGRLAVGVGRDIFVRDPTGDVGSLMRCPLGPTGDDYLTALKWSGCGKMMAYGTDKGDVLVREIESGVNYLKLGNRRARVSVLSWNNELVFQGFRSGGIRFHDIRTPLERAGRFKAHEGVVCGMAWNQSGMFLATGGNDNLVKVWDTRKVTESLLTLTLHEAAIKVMMSLWLATTEKTILLSHSY